MQFEEQSQHKSQQKNWRIQSRREWAGMQKVYKLQKSFQWAQRELKPCHVEHDNPIWELVLPQEAAGGRRAAVIPHSSFQIAPTVGTCVEQDSILLQHSIPLPLPCWRDTEAASSWDSIAAMKLGIPLFPWSFGLTVHLPDEETAIYSPSRCCLIRILVNSTDMMMSEHLDNSLKI